MATVMVLSVIAASGRARAWPRTAGSVLTASGRARSWTRVCVVSTATAPRRKEEEGNFPRQVDHGQLDAICGLFPAQADQVRQYVAMLQAYNTHTNIYSQSSYDKLPFHIHDSLLMGSHISQAPGPVLDLGSGSGLPSVLVALMNPLHKVHAVESKGRKTAFLKDVAVKLELPNLAVYTANIMELARGSPFAVKYVTAKAFKPLPDVIRIAQRSIEDEATLLVPVSRKQVVDYRDEGLLDEEREIIMSADYRYFRRVIAGRRQ